MSDEDIQPGEKYVLLTEEGCSGCHQVKKALSRELSSGEIDEMPIETEEGKHLDDEFKPRYVPFCLIRSTDGRYRPCKEGTVDDLIDKALEK